MTSYVFSGASGASTGVTISGSGVTLVTFGASAGNMLNLVGASGIGGGQKLIIDTGSALLEAPVAYASSATTITLALPWRGGAVTNAAWCILPSVANIDPNHILPFILGLQQYGPLSKGNALAEFVGDLAAQAAARSNLGLGATDVIRTDAQSLSTAQQKQARLNMGAAPAWTGVGFKNRVINGDFRVNQRGYSSGPLADGVFGHDRWKASTGGWDYAFATVAGFVTVTNTGLCKQVIEGANVPEGGTYTLSWTGSATARVYQGAASGSYAVSPITVTGMTAGADTTIEFGPGTMCKVQYEIGAEATPFETRPFGVELALCQRYFEKSYELTQAPGTATSQFGRVAFYGSATIHAGFRSPIPFKVMKRAIPTITIYNTTNGTSGQLTNGSDAAFTAVINEYSSTAFAVGHSNGTALDGIWFQWAATAEL